MSRNEIRDDFDEIARQSEALGESPQPYEAELLALVPEPCRLAVDVGCGTGGFTRALAHHAARVVAFDLSPEMIRIARARSALLSNIDYQVADLEFWSPPPWPVDLVVSIAALHHLELSDALRRLASFVRPGGTLLVHDLIADHRGLVGFGKNVLGAGLRRFRLLRGRSRFRQPKALRAAWKAHFARESYMTMGEVRATFAKSLPGARLTEHLEWRYTAVWERTSV